MRNLHCNQRASTTLINYSKNGCAFVHCISARKLSDARNGSGEGFYLTQSQDECAQDFKRLSASSSSASSPGRLALAVPELLLLGFCVTMMICQLLPAVGLPSMINEFSAPSFDKIFVPSVGYSATNGYAEQAGENIGTYLTGVFNPSADTDYHVAVKLVNGEWW